MNAQEKENAMKSLLGEYLESYAVNKGKMQIKAWLAQELQGHLPEKSPAEITKITDEIITSLNIQQEKAKSLDEAVKSGMSKEKWFSNEMKKMTSDLDENQRADFIKNFGEAVAKNKAELAEAVTGSSPEEIKVPSSFEEIAKDIGQSAIMGQVITNDVILSKDFTEVKDTPSGKIIQDELKSGNDLGVKTAVAGAGYTAAERGIIEAPVENRTSIFSAVSNTVVENLKAVEGIAQTFGESIQRAARTTVGTTVGFFAAVKTLVPSATLGGKIGWTVGGFLGAPVGFAVGGVLGALTSYYVGKTFAERTVTYIQKTHEKLIDKTVEVTKSAAKTTVKTVKNVGKSVLKYFGY